MTSISISHPDSMHCTRDIQKAGYYGQARMMHRILCCIHCIVVAAYGAILQLAGFIPNMLKLTQVSGILEEKYIYLPKYTSLHSANPSELLSETLKFQEKLLGESKKRKREPLRQPMRTELPSFTTNTLSPSQNCNSIESQSPADALPFLSCTTPYSQPTHEIMISRTPVSTDASIIHSTWSRLISWIFRNLFYTVFSRNPSEQILIVQGRPLLHTSAPFLPRQTTCLPLIIRMNI